MLRTPHEAGDVFLSEAEDEDVVSGLMASSLSFLSLVSLLLLLLSSLSSLPVDSDDDDEHVGCSRT